MSRDPSFLSELKRRNVYKVAVAYAAVAWLLIQVATQVFPFFEIPSSVVRLLVLLVGLGFPVALVLAWAFELTPEGIKRADEDAPNELRGRRTGRKLVALTVVIALLAAGLLAFQFLRSRPAFPALATPAAGSPSVPDKSIAVLPFENLSSDKENGYFAFGIQDEILTRAGKIASLKVIARTSTRQYESKPANLAEVGMQLGVANILEGSVQRVGDKVRVNVQLIRVATNKQLWGETYDRQLTDVFAVESEIASRIASSLQAALSPDEKALVNAIPTTNPEAYDLYVQGRESMYAHNVSPENDLKSKQGYERAIALDPTFALGYTALSEVYSFDALDHGVTAENKMKARSYADEALRLQPDLGEAHVALGSYYYRVERNYDAAMKEYSTALKSQPNDAELLRNIAMLERRRGNWHAAIELSQRAVTLDPRSLLVIEALADQYTAIHQLAAAEDTRRREVAVAKTIPKASEVSVAWALCGIQWLRTGRTDQMHASLEQYKDKLSDGERVEMKAGLGWLERNPDAVIEACRDVHSSDLRWALAHAYLAKGDPNAAHGVVLKELPPLEEKVRTNRDEPRNHSQLGMLYAVLGRKEDAIREGRRAVELLSESRDAVDGWKFTGNLAYIYAHAGETDQAIKLVEHMVDSAPWFIDDEFWHSFRGLQVCWEWDPLRSDPRFQKLVGGEPPKVTFK